MVGQAASPRPWLAGTASEDRWGPTEPEGAGPCQGFAACGLEDSLRPAGRHPRIGRTYRTRWARGFVPLAKTERYSERYTRGTAFTGGRHLLFFFFIKYLDRKREREKQGLYLLYLLCLSKTCLVWAAAFDCVTPLPPGYRPGGSWVEITRARFREVQEVQEVHHVLSVCGKEACLVPLVYPSLYLSVLARGTPAARFKRRACVGLV